MQITFTLVGSDAYCAVKTYDLAPGATRDNALLIAGVELFGWARTYHNFRSDLSVTKALLEGKITAEVSE